MPFTEFRENSLSAEGSPSSKAERGLVSSQPLLEAAINRAGRKALLRGRREIPGSPLATPPPPAARARHGRGSLRGRPAALALATPGSYGKQLPAGRA